MSLLRGYQDGLREFSFAPNQNSFSFSVTQAGASEKPKGSQTQRYLLFMKLHSHSRRKRKAGGLNKARREDFSHQFLEEFTHPSTQLRNNIAHMPTTLRADYKARKADLYKSTQNHLA